MSGTCGYAAAAISAPTDLKPPPFELHIHPRSLVTLGGVTAHFIGVTNPAGQPERRARIYLDSMEERPRNIMPPQYEPVIPYLVRCVRRGRCGGPRRGS